MDTRSPVASFAHKKPVLSASFGAGGTLLATPGVDKTMSIWEVASATQLARLKFDRPVIAATFVPTDEPWLQRASDTGQCGSPWDPPDHQRGSDDFIDSHLARYVPLLRLAVGRRWAIALASGGLSKAESGRAQRH